MLKLGRFRQQIRNTWKVLKCGAGEGWRRLVGPIMWEMEEVLRRVNEQRNILHEIRKRKTNWIGHIFHRNCLLKQVIEGKVKGEMEVTRRWGRSCKKLLDDLEDRKGYAHLKEGALNGTMWRNCFGGGFEPVVKQNTEWWWYRVCRQLLSRPRMELVLFCYWWVFISWSRRKWRVECVMDQLVYGIMFVCALFWNKLRVLLMCLDV